MEKTTMLTKEIARNIVKETSLRLNRNINIMNEKGVIIASGDSSRIDQIHEGAIQVIKTCQPLAITSENIGQWKGAQKGINLPIVFQERTVGVIGITGDPEQVSEFGGLVRMTTELMINQSFIASQQEWKQMSKEMIIEELLKANPSLKHIRRRLELLGLELNPPFSVAVIQIAERSIPNHTLIQRLEDIIGAGNGLTGFVNVNRMFIAFSGQSEDVVVSKLTRILQALAQTNLKFRIAYSTPVQQIERISQAYLDCDLTLELSDREQELVSFAEIEPKALLYQINPLLAERFVQRVLGETLMSYADTLQAFFSCNQNIKETAEQLFIHRNTLIYRLKRIKEESSYDPQNFKDAFTLQMALWISAKLKGQEHDS